MTVTVPQAPALSNVPAVELMRIGQWDISSGTATFTRDDLAGAVAAAQCPAVRRPVLKLGHTDPRFDGEPAVGWVGNLAVTDDGATLVGDYLGMPGWLADVLGSAYPDRSVEGLYDFRCQLGHTHPFVLTGLALLGVTAPGIGTLTSLQDIAALYGVAAAERAPRGVPVTIRAKGAPVMPNPRPATVAAGVTTEDVRRAYYDDAPWSVWIEEFHLDPLQLITLDDTTATRHRIPVIVSDGDGEDAVTFGPPVEVVIRYDDVTPDNAPTGDPAEEAPVAASAIRYASRAESRPGTATPIAAGAAHAGGVVFSAAQASALRERLGVTRDVGADQLIAALEEVLAEQALPELPELPEGTVAVDVAVLEQLQVAARTGQTAAAAHGRSQREQQVNAAVADGRIPPARREHWVHVLELDPAAGAVLASLAPGLVPLTETGHSNESISADVRTTEAYLNWT